MFDWLYKVIKSLLKLLFLGLSKVFLVLLGVLRQIIFFSKHQVLKIWRSNFIENPNNTKTGIISFVIILTIVVTVMAGFFVFDSDISNQDENTTNSLPKDVSLDDLNYALEDIGTLFNSISKTAADFSGMVQITENCMRKLNHCRDNSYTTDDLDICQDEYKGCLP